MELRPIESFCKNDIITYSDATGGFRRNGWLSYDPKRIDRSNTFIIEPGEACIVLESEFVHTNDYYTIVLLYVRCTIVQYVQTVHTRGEPIWFSIA